MDSVRIELTAAQRDALLAQPQAPVYIADEQTQKIYMLVEKGQFPELEEEYIREGLEMARAQIARGETSRSTIDEIISKAEQRLDS